MKQKNIALLLVACLVFLVGAGCKNAPAQKNTNTPKVDSVDSKPQEQKQKTQEELQAEKLLEEQKIEKMEPR